MNARKREEIEGTKDAREFYKLAAHGCEVCRQAPGTDIHEICAGQFRHLAVWQPNNWLCVCRSCHDRIQSKPHLEQLRLKCEAVVTSYRWITGRQIELEEVFDGK